jgi:predicted transposase YbfD/YdcC
LLNNHHKTEEGQMECNTPTFDVNLNPSGFVVDLDSLYAHLVRLRDRRHARGLRYALVTVLGCVVLAKLAGEDRLFGIAQWVRYRKELLADALHLDKPRAPCVNTYRAILGQVIDIEEFEQVVREFFAAQPQAGQSIVVALDGKTLRGTITAGSTRGRHLLAAYLPAEGWVVFQVEVVSKENEISAAPRVLKCLDLRGKIVTGDAMFAQRELSLPIVELGGDYIWTVKDNQSALRQDIELLFQPEQTVKGFSPGTKDFRTSHTSEKRHGRVERRVLTVSAELKMYLDWPGAEQVFKLERHFKRTRDGQVTHEVVYGITSLTAQEAGPKRLLQLTRSHWGIENGLHYRRDETLREDWCHLKQGQAPRAMAVINNLIIGLVLHLGWTNLAVARRYFDAHLQETQRLVLLRLP